MAKVYVLSSGSYSDYRVEGVFSSPEKALEAGARWRISDVNGPVEFELDETSPEDPEEFERGPVYEFHLRLKDGAGWLGKQSDDWFRHPRRCEVSSCTDIYEYASVTVLSPISEEHARKVAVEKRQEWLRTGKIEGATGGDDD